MGTPLKVTFLLPCAGQFPIGGFRVIYEYANRLAARGHSVTVVHGAAVQAPTSFRDRVATWRMCRSLRRSGAFRPDLWFTVDPRVQMVLVPSLRARFIPAGDVVVATAWQTAEYVMEYPAAKGKKLYFVQDYEFYMTADAATRARMAVTYRSGMSLLTAAAVVREILAENGITRSTRAPYGIDFGSIFREVAIESPARTGVVGFPLRPEPFKRTADAIAALELVRSTYSGPLRIQAFGVDRITVPDWVEFHQMLDPAGLRAFYNRTAILVLPSLYEGFGLPGAEALASGAALVSTDSGGVREYAIHERTALLSRPGDPGALARNVLRLLQDEPLRSRLASQGEQHIRTFTWDGAADAFEQALTEAPT